MSEWCRANRKEPTRRRFVNWLNRTDRPVKAAAQSSFLKVQKFEGQSGEVQL